MTIKDISDKLNVSISTVSKALNDATDISMQTKKKILDYIETTDFIIKKKKANIKRLCLFLEDMGLSSEHIGYEIMTGFKTMAAKYNYDVIIKSISHYDTGINYNLDMKQNNFIGAFIIGTNLKSTLYQQLGGTCYPTVVLDNCINNPYVATIGIDNINTMTMLLDHLYELGHRQIGFLNGEKKSVVSRERLSGYICGLMNNELLYNPQIVKYGDFTENCGEQFVDGFIQNNVSAIMCASDLMAIGLINALTNKGIKVPDDISVTGFDDIALARYVTPSITTIKQDFLSIGKNAFTILRQLIKGNSPERVVLNGELIIRNSTTKKM